MNPVIQEALRLLEAAYDALPHGQLATDIAKFLARAKATAGERPPGPHNPPKPDTPWEFA